MTNILGTDGYKFSMAQAGFPLRRETFYLSFRRGGWFYNPFDLEAKVRELIPETPEGDRNYELDLVYLRDNNYRLTQGMHEALKGELEIRAIPQGSWFSNQEPILTVTGPSFLVSWLEAQLTWLNYPIQLATRLKAGVREKAIEVISDQHEAIVREVLDALKIDHPIERVKDYPKRVLQVAREMVAALDSGDVDLRLIEGGMRSAISMDHHNMVLEACREVGIRRTSNVELSVPTGMIPAGTAGHEHSQRSGSDPVAYANYMDRVCGLVSCLSDTVSTLNSGLPATIDIARKNPHRNFLFRLDSGDRMSYFHIAATRFRQEEINNVIINVAGDVNAQMMREFEPLRKLIDWEPDRLSYMIGGQLTAETLPTTLTRSRVACVFKLSMTGDRPTMKLGDDVGVGKRSWPGHPVTWRRLRGSGPVGIVGQLGEPVPENYIVLNGNPKAAEALNLTRAYPRLTDSKQFHWDTHPVPYIPSPGTQALIDRCVAEMRRLVREAQDQGETIHG